jgi:hypothetical protein
MQLTSAGLLAETYWHEIPKHADHVELGEFVVMPNHIHGILILNGNGCQSDNDPVETRHAPVETRHALSLQQYCNVTDRPNHNPPRRMKTLPSISVADTVSLHRVPRVLNFPMD